MRKQRLYSLFERQDGKWVRIRVLAYTKNTAVLIFQNALLAPFLGGEDCKGIRELRVVRD